MPPRATPVLLAAAVAALAAAGCGLRGGRLALLEENDVLNLGDGLGVDRDYTQGGALALTLADADTPEWAGAAAEAVPLFAGGAPVHLGLLLGQEIYTPKHILRPVPFPDDRPYAGWLHAGIALQSPVLDGDPERRRDRLDHLQIDLGVVGPASLAEPSQNAAHGILEIPKARGWDTQLGNEPGLLATWESRWRVAAGGLGAGWGWDLLPRLQARAGNVRVDATAGATARVGWNLPRDFGPMPVDSHGLTAGSGPPRPWVAFSAGADGRGVLHDVFLDGSTWGDGASVTPRGFVHTATLGIAAGRGPLSASFSQVLVSPEFRERPRHHRYSRVLLSWAWFF